MAMLASKTSFPATVSSSGTSTLVGNSSASNMPHTRRPHPTPAPGQAFASPTESEFSDEDSPDAVKNWTEDQVCEYLRSVKCGEYEKLFRKNNINGENLLEMDKEVLKEMGIDKVGDRVRLFLGIKKLRTKTYANQKKRNRDSMALFDSQYPPSNTSPQLSNSVTRPMPKRHPRQADAPGHGLTPAIEATKPTSRPGSPPHTADLRSTRSIRYPQGQSYVPNTATAGRAPNSPPESFASGRLVTTHTRNNSSQDGPLMAALPQDQGFIKVISTGGITKVVKIADCANCEEVMRVTLRKFALREDHDRNYCFWVLAGVEPDPRQCRRLGDTELWHIIRDPKRPERNRLILRKVHSGEPGESELRRAADIGKEEAQQQHARALENVDKRSQSKLQKLLGEDFSKGLQQSLSPLSYQDRERNLHAMDSERLGMDLQRPGLDLERPALSPNPVIPRRKALLRSFGGLRPPSELITSDLTSYFPDHPREDIDRTARLSMRRSTRLSKVNSRLSVASNLSFASSIQYAPPIPNIADSWLSSGHLAKVRARDGQGRSPHNYRDSVTSSVLDTLQEESPIEPNRKSYVSFADSGSDTAPVSVTDPDGNVIRHSYYDESSTLGSESLKELTQALSEDGEDADEELASFLAGESWTDNKWMKGALIGQGSFGSVYLALHAVTGELLAVKQVEAPSPGTNSQTDARKKSMIEALKREIGLLRDLRHPNIVQYLGCGSSNEYLNIFLEYVPGGSVQTMLNSYGALPEPLVRSFVRQILEGLSYLHNRDIIHRDIKGANILVDNKGTIKISDFGISKKIEATNILSGPNNNRNRPSLQGSVFWMAPEVVKQTSYTRKADIWSLGCLVVEMMTGEHPFPNCSQLQAIFKIGGGKAAPTIPDNASPEAEEFLSRTFEIDHNLRPSADDLRLSPFLTPIT